MFKVYDKLGKEINCEVLFVFNRDNKDFICYLDDDNDIMASFYRKDGDNYIIEEITDDKDFDIVDEELDKRDL